MGDYREKVLQFYIFIKSESKAFYFKFIYSVINKSDNSLFLEFIND